MAPVRFKLRRRASGFIRGGPNTALSFNVHRDGAEAIEVDLKHGHGDIHEAAHLVRLAHLLTELWSGIGIGAAFRVVPANRRLLQGKKTMLDGLEQGRFNILVSAVHHGRA